METNDRAFSYGKILCFFGSLGAEGDGEKMIRCWHLLLPHFKVADRKKYALTICPYKYALTNMPNMPLQICPYNYQLSLHSELCGMCLGRPIAQQDFILFKPSLSFETSKRIIHE